MRIRVGINGMGRVGRAVLRGIADRPDSGVEVVAVTDLAPVADVSLVDFTVHLAEKATVDQVNRAFAVAAEGTPKGFVRYSTDPIVSQDVLGDPASCVFDAGLTTVTGDLAKVFGWYDNEWGYAQRTIDLVEMVARAPPER